MHCIISKIKYIGFLRLFVLSERSARLQKMSSFDMQDKVAIVTGGGDGIGLAIVKEFLSKNVKGVVIGDVAVEKDCKSTMEKFGKDKVIFSKCDVTKKDELLALFKTAKDKWKKLDILVNNAGILNDPEWEREIATNIMANVRGTYLGLEYMGKNKGAQGGTIVTLSSVLGLQPLPLAPIYAGTKHFLVGFNRSIGDPYQYKQTGVRILTVCPGITQTNLFRKADKFAHKSLARGMFAKYIDSLPRQDAEVVGRHLITLLEKAASGSVWIVEADECYEVDLPDRKTFKKK